MFFAFFLACSITNTLAVVDPDQLRNTSELIQSKGYPCEEYDVQTLDGYVLTIQRIPHGQVLKNVTKRPIVYLQHGLLDASSTWVANLQNESLGFLLADAGFDVWLGNMRGNTYCKRHVKLDPKSEAFWNFTWNEMAKYDLTAIISFILRFTHEKDLVYIGHSQGTLIAFAELSRNRELASKIRLFIALAPIGTVAHIESPLRLLAGPTPQADDLYFALFGRRDFLPQGRLFKWLSDKVCANKLLVKEFCENLMFVISGPSRFLNESRIPVYTSHDPAGTSVKNMLHFTQMVYSKKIQMFDYGSTNANLKHYNQVKKNFSCLSRRKSFFCAIFKIYLCITPCKSYPPLYDYTQISVPIALVWSENDWLADPQDVQYLRSTLKTIVYEKYVLEWDHLDFLLATNAPQYLYYDLIHLLKAKILSPTQKF